MRLLNAMFANALCWLVASCAIAAPEIVSIDMYDTTNTTLANTTEYKTPVNPRLVVRRAQKYYFFVTTNKEAPQSAWNIVPSAKRTWDNTGVAILPAPGPPPFPDDDWYFKVSPGFVGFDTQEFLVEISIPKDAEIGTYEFRVDAVVTIADGGGRIPGLALQKVFPKKVVALFNPWKANDPVYLSDAKDRDEYIKNPDGVLVLKNGYDFPWNYNQFDEVSLDVLNYFLDQTPLLDRTSPVDVTREIAGGCNWRDWGQGILEGRWAATFPAPGKEPFFWKSSGQVFKEYTKAGPPYATVKYGQCWVFSGISTSLLRTAGIPARPVTAQLTAIDNSSPPDGHIDLYYDYSPVTKKYTRNFAKSTDSYWNYHVWTEAWMKRADLTGGDGWQVIDATSQANGPGLTRIGPASREINRNSATPPASDYDAAFMWSSALADDDVYLESKTIPGMFAFDHTDDNAKALYSKTVYTKKRGAGGHVDIASEYRPGPRPAPSEGERLTNPYFTVEFSANDAVNVGQDVTGTVRITNGPGEARTFYVSFGAALNFYNGDMISILADPNWPDVTLDPGEWADLPLTVPAGALAPFLSPTDEYVRFFGAVNCEQVGIVETIKGEGGALLQSPALLISLNPPGPIPVSGVSNGVPAYTNTSGLILTNVHLVWKLSSQLTFGGTDTLDVPLPDLPPNASIPQILAPFYAVSLGTGTVSASLECGQLSPSLASATIKVESCPGDFDGNGTVDDEDFVIFAGGYDAYDCASPDMNEGCVADLTGDGYVDDADFMEFAEAYDAYYCTIPTPAR